MIELSPKQAEGVEWLGNRTRGYLADPPGFGKSRQLLAAAAKAPHVTVVCPAAIRDAEVWQGEAKRIGFDVPMRVMSYHELIKKPVLDPGALILDEAHHLKNRKVAWGSNIEVSARRSLTTFEASGTPMPNAQGVELWGQLRMIRPDLPAYWPWVQSWFDVVPDDYTAYSIPGTLKACTAAGCHPQVQDCVHWQAFYLAEYGPEVMLRRGEEDIDLPELAGYDFPVIAKMTPTQRKAYGQMKKDYLAELPEGVTLEAMTESSKFAQLWQMSTGLSSANPEADDRHSGKLALLAELLADRSNPTLVACYFHNTAAAVSRVCDRLKLSWAPFGANTSRKTRRDAIAAFQAGNLDVLIGSISVVSEGLTLTAADAAFMVERHWVPDVNLQAVKRVHRRGQTKAVTVRQLVTPVSIDDGQWKVLAEKQAYISRAMTRTEVASLL